MVEYEIGHTELRQTEEGLPIYFEYEVTNRGNVEWRPDEIRFSLINSLLGTSAGDLNISGDALEFAQPGGSSRVVTEVAHSLDPGSYSVDIEFIDDGQIVYSSESSLIVFQEGTLRQVAQVISLTTNKETYKTGEKIKLTATMANTGDLETTGVVIAEVYSEEGELIDILTSNPRTVASQEQVQIDQFLDLATVGVYKIEAYIEYAGSKVTETLSTTVIVQEISLTSPGFILPIILLIAAGGMLIGVIIFIISKWKKKRKQTSAPVPPQAPQAEPKQQAAPAPIQQVAPQTPAASPAPAPPSPTQPPKTSSPQAESRKKDDDLWTISL